MKIFFSAEDQIKEHDHGFLPIQLRPHETSDALTEIGGNYLDRMFERIYAAKRCFAPHVPLGSSILFEHEIVHGSYRHSQMTIPRFSLDFRATGIYRRSLENAKYEGVMFRSIRFPGVLQRTVVKAGLILGGLLRGDDATIKGVRKRLPF